MESSFVVFRRLFPLENFSTLSILVPRTAAVQRAANYWSQRILKCRDEISTPWKCAPDNPLKISVKWIQREVYAKELSVLARGKAVKQEKLAPLSPVLINGVICLKKRVEKAKKLLQSQKTPAILPSRHHFTELLIQAEHER
ncbi:hypothetical protein LAZ67_14002305 [Cordylochernes scorpioides]|uniref:Uncharacterized protein n=1 Tax=Cordylochernes scorpioides TaxID=51811 RepID=A0ABY6L9F0_9ARAC|nr:hypothetical protein LAZ67_14002305 [Cordylochernes scorpioides]